MKKRLLLLFVIITSSSIASNLLLVRDTGIVFYFDQDWDRVETRSEASYSRIVSFRKSDRNLNYPIRKVKTFYIKRKENGKIYSRKYSETSYLFYDINDNSNCKLKGLATYYYDNEKNSKRVQRFYDRNGVLQDTAKTWHENGEILSVAFYVDGSVQGMYTTYNPDGTIVSSVEYIDGKKDGWYKEFHSNGKPKYWKLWDMGKPVDKYAWEFDIYGDCKLVARDYFANNANNWPVNSNSDEYSYNLDTVNGQYSIISRVDDGFIKPCYINFGSILDHPEWFSISDYVIEAEVRQTSRDTDASYGILFGVKDYQNYMYFRISETNNTCNVIRVEDGLKEKMTGYESIGNLLKKGDYNRFQIRQNKHFDSDGELESITLNFVINGQSVVECQSNYLSDMKFGFGVYGDNTKLTANYFNIRYPCPPATDNSVENNESSCAGAGTGFAIHEDGYIATNFHVIGKNKDTGETCEDIKVIGIDGDFSKYYGARVILTDPERDLAILKINYKIYDIPYGITNNVDIAEKVYAFGYPEPGSENTIGRIKLTEGSVSDFGLAEDVNISYVTDFLIDDTKVIEHTSIIKKGNSGGPLFNSDGEIIGVNTLGYQDANKYHSVGSYHLDILMQDISIDFGRNQLDKLSIEKQYKEIKDFVYQILVGIDDDLLEEILDY